MLFNISQYPRMRYQVVGFLVVDPRHCQDSSSLLTVRADCFVSQQLLFTLSLLFVQLLRVCCFSGVWKPYRQLFLGEVSMLSGGMLSVCSWLDLCLWLCLSVLVLFYLWLAILGILQRELLDVVIGGEFFHQVWSSVLSGILVLVLTPALSRETFSLVFPVPRSS